MTYNMHYKERFAEKNNFINFQLLLEHKNGDMLYIPRNTIWSSYRF